MPGHKKYEHKKRITTKPTYPTIGLLIPNVYQENEELWWRSAMDAARDNKVNMVCFTGGYLDISDGYEAQANILYKLISHEQIDGLVIFSTVGWFIGKEKLVDFCKGYEPLPVVSVDVNLAGIPSVVKSNYQGMREAMVHLIEDHGYRRIAFLCGPENTDWALERLRAYTETMADYGLDVNERLIAPAPATWEFSRPEISPGTQQINILLNERNLKPGIDFEALVGATDSLIQEAVFTLQKRGVNVPEQVAVTGVDDEPASGVITPPLTTVRPPFYEMGYKAVELVLALLAGEKIPELVNLPCKLVIRQSCGCMTAEVEQVVRTTGDVKSNNETLDTMLTVHRVDIVADLAQSVSLHKLNPGLLEQLLNGFVSEVKGSSQGLFLSELKTILHRVSKIGGNVRLWHNVISVLRHWLRPCLDTETLTLADDLWHQARIMIGNAAERVQAYQALQAEQHSQMLRDVGQKLITTFEIERLMDILAGDLPRLNFPSCYLSLYETPQTYQYTQPNLELSRLMLAYDEHGRVDLEPDELRFPSSQLLPAKMWPHRQFCFVVEPLYFRNNQLGLALFEIGPREGMVYEVLRGQISSALQGALLVQRVREHSSELTRQQYILNSFMDNIPDYIYFKDLDSHFTRVNQAHALHFGLSDPSLLIGKSDFDFLKEEQALPRFEQEQEIIRTGQPLLNFEETDDIKRWTLTTKMPLRDENGTIIGTFGISHDITELKRVQEELEQFAFIASHDLKEPLRKIRFFGEILQKKYSNGLDEKALEYIHIMNNAAIRMGNFINDLLQYSRITTKAKSFESTDLNKVLKEVFNDLEIRINETKTKIKKDNLPVIDADPLQIKQLFQNIIGNAIKYHRPNVSPIININSKIIKKEDGRKYCEINISDNGIGFDNKYSEQIFGLFRRLHARSEYEGTGIGLAVCKKIVDQHNGIIRVYSKEMEGSTFYIQLPIKQNVIF